MARERQEDHLDVYPFQAPFTETCLPGQRQLEEDASANRYTEYCPARKPKWCVGGLICDQFKHRGSSSKGSGQHQRL